MNIEVKKIQSQSHSTTAVENGDKGKIELDEITELPPIKSQSATMDDNFEELNGDTNLNSELDGHFCDEAADPEPVKKNNLFGHITSPSSVIENPGMTTGTKLLIGAMFAGLLSKFL